MSRRFDGKIALVTGAAAGIGRACMHRLAAEGATIIGVGRDSAKLGAAVRNGAGEIVAMTCDVADPQAIDAMVADAIARFGAIHVLVNNAGIGNPQRARLHRQTLEDWDRVMAVNVRCMFLMQRAIIPHMLHHGGGAIVQHGLDRKLSRHRAVEPVYHLQGCGADDDARRGGGLCQGQYPRQRGLPRHDQCGHPRRYLARRGTPMTLDELHEHNIILYAAIDRPVGQWRFARYAERLLRPRSIATLNHGDALASAAIVGIGLAQTLEMLVALELALGTLLLVRTAWNRESFPVQLFILRDRTSQPAVRAVADFLRDQVDWVSSSRWNAAGARCLPARPARNGSGRPNPSHP